MHPLEYQEIPREWKTQKISILLPFLNEESIIAANTREALRIMEEYGMPFELVLIDDGSRDRSYSSLKEAFSDDPRVVLVHNEQNFGKGWALKTGFEYSSGDLILFLDSDLELSPKHLPNFLRIMSESGADAVIGSKLHPDSRLHYPLGRRIISYIYYTFIRVFFSLPIMDSQTGIKLFRRDALESCLPKVLVKKFAFDIELMILLHKNGRKISTAPIELLYTRQKFGNIRLKTLVKTFWDTMAVVYRDKILNFYSRPFGPNTLYRYTIILFSDQNDDYEKSCLEYFLKIAYRNFQVVLLGTTDFSISHPRLTFIRTAEFHYTDRLKTALPALQDQSDFMVFARLDSFPDERFLYNTGRILSLEGMGAAGGFLTLRSQATPYETRAFYTIGSTLLNATRSYRYRQDNYRMVDELQLNGLFARSEIIRSMKLENRSHLKLEYLISKEVTSRGLKLAYSPDIFLYTRFAADSRELRSYLKRDATFRAMQWKSPLYQRWKTWKDGVYTLSLAALVVLGLTAVLTPLNIWAGAPLAFYLLTVFASRANLYGLKLAPVLTVMILLSQIQYGWFYLTGLFKKPR